MKLTKKGYLASLLAVLSVTSCVNMGNNLVTTTNSPQELDFANSETNLAMDEINSRGFNVKAVTLKPGDIIPGKFIVKLKANTNEANFLKRKK